MKKFLSKILLFILAVILFLAGTVYLVKYHSRFKFDRNRNYLVIGNSHPQYAFNDRIIKGLLNVGNSGEPYFYSYYKTKKIIEQNAGIHTVFIEFSNDQIDKVMNEWIWSDNAMFYFLPKYALFMDNEALKVLRANNPASFKESIFSVLKNNFKVLSRGLNYTHKIGQYKYSDDNKTDSLLHDLASTKKVVEKNELSPLNIDYLGKLINYLHQQQISVFLVRAPLHPMYSTYRNEKLFQEIRSTRFSNIEFMDFANFPLSNAEFADFGHLNSKGAKVFSECFNNLLANGLLTKSNKQEIINREISLKMQRLVAKN